MRGKYFDELKVGDTFVSPRRTITETDMVIFTSLTGLLNPLFTDEEFARERGLGGRIVPGPLTVCFALGLTDGLVYGTATAALGLDNVRFPAVVKPGDTIRIKTTVANRRESASHPDQGIVSFRHEVYNQRGATVCTLERTLMLLKSPPEGKVD